MVPEQINSGTLAEVQGVQTRRPVEGTCGSALLASCPDSAPTCPHISLSGPDSPKHIIFDGALHQSVLRHSELADRSFVVSSFGKTYHCTGWKVGYCIAPRVLSAEFRKVHQYLTFCTFTPAQVALAEFLQTQPQHYLELPAFYQARREFFRELLGPTRFRVLPVAGAYFQLVDYSAISDKDDFGFCEWLVAHAGVAAIPISAFYESPPPDMRLV